VIYREYNTVKSYIGDQRPLLVNRNKGKTLTDYGKKVIIKAIKIGKEYGKEFIGRVGRLSNDNLNPREVPTLILVKDEALYLEDFIVEFE